MKKTLLAAALFAGFAGFAGAAQAETQVTLYGILDTGIEFLNIKTASGNAQPSYNSIGLDSGNQSGSRWGMKGTEDLGNGTQAFFTLESGYVLTDGKSAQGGRLFGRRAYMGLQNPSWGMFRIGRGPTISTDMFQGAATDPFAYAFGPFNLGNVATSINTYRTDNQIGYESPVFAGFQVGGSYSFNTDDTVTGTSGIGVPLTKRTSGMDVAATYTNGPLFVGLTYGQTNPYAASSATSGRVRQVVLTGSYNFQVATVYASYVRGWNGLVGGDGGVTMGSGGVTGITLPSGNTYYNGMKQNAFELGATIPVGTSTSLLATFEHQTLAGGGYTGNGSAMNEFGVGALYSLSKRTNLYGVVGYVNGVGNISGQKETAAIVGMRHQF